MADDRLVVMGIDEAGYGPILGPLVVSAATFQMPRPVASSCLWKVLADSVASSSTARDGRVVIQDSKKLFHRKDGLGRLERSVLSAVAAWSSGELPMTMSELIARLSPDCDGFLQDYAWYETSAARLPRAADEGAVRIAGAMFARDMAARGVRLAGLASEILPEGHFNRLVEMTRNKASALFGLVLRLIQRAANANPQSNMLVFVDRQGARGHYGALLMQAFEDRKLRVLEEGDEESAYDLVGSRNVWRIRFSQSGESKHLPVALASMMSKYIRELFMERFNDYWRQFDSALAPTAGYYEDGLRFLRDIEPHARRLGIEQKRLVRQR